ncbi:hypothetical protein [Neisseria chenwenguii]|uniref:Uncharacterized protein n=1 Tax=Neisseria chenwenguii TaxID=1853278 RepID=A0A220S201_9NEIS|nr:hypothetical protein [Neisseria chenwenguii]ASK27388.1 hypothetical protein BG910_06230 [Neisseria chenwenguii]ROV56941.1 hypothetical protein EGS38_01960 [Neisseria chenwenguii]
MNRTTLRKIHAIAAVMAFCCIALFWSSTLISELFLSLAAVVKVKQLIVYTMILFIPSMAIMGATGMKMGGKSTFAPIAAKRKRMPVIAMNGLLILLPAAFFLNSKAQAEAFDSVFYTVQVIELLAGLVNLSLMGLSMRDGFAIRRGKKRDDLI